MADGSMANENVSTFLFALPKWSMNGAPKIAYDAVSREALGFAASRLQDQADYLKKLSDCEDLAEVMKYQLEFAQQFWSRYLGEASKVFDHLRTQSTPGSSSLRRE